MSDEVSSFAKDRCSLAVLARWTRLTDRDDRRAIARSLGALLNPDAGDLLSELLMDSDNSVRLTAAVGLARLGDPASLRGLGEAILRSGLEDEREELAAALEEAAVPETLPLLLSLLGSVRDGARMHAARTLGRIGRQEAVGPLNESLDLESDTGVGPAAAQALAAIGAGHSRVQLLELLKSAQPWRPLYAALALLKDSDPQAVPALGELAQNAPELEVRCASLEALRAVAGEVPDSLLAALVKDGSAEVRRQTAFLAARSATKGALEVLSKLAKDSDWTVRQKTAVALAAVRDGRAEPILKKLLSDRDSDVQAAALSSGTDLGLEFLGEQAHKWLNGTDGTLRRVACAWFGAHGGDSRALGPIVAMARDGGSALRADAVGALGGFPIADTVGILIAALDDPQWRVQLAAARVLEGAGEEAARTISEAMEGSEDEGQLAKLAWALDKLGDPSRTREVLLARGQSQPLVWTSAAESAIRAGDRTVLPSLVGGLSYRDPRIREAAAHALGKLGGLHCVPALVAALGDPGWDVRTAAGIALGALAAEAPGALIGELLEGRRSPSIREGLVRTMSGMKGEATVNALVLALRDPSRLVRAAAADALGSMGANQAVGPLMLAIEDDDRGVRNAAAGALRKIGGNRALAAVEGWTLERRRRAREVRARSD